jgi:hypothetical protein
MKALVQIIILLVISSSCINQSNRDKKSSQDKSLKIQFLSTKEGGKAILDESYEPYFSQLQIREIEAFINDSIPTVEIKEARDYARKKFADAVIDFTKDEKACIEFVLDKVYQTLSDNNLGLMANHPWKFIKIENWLCGGFAHTRADYIIISQRHLDYLSKTWSKNMSSQDEDELVLKLGSLLVHEQTHSLQRKYKERFIDLYTQFWNFKQVQVKPEQQIIIDQVSNPDAPIAEWIFPDPEKENTFYWARTLLAKTDGIPVMGKDFRDKIFTVEENDGVYEVKRDTQGKLLTMSISDIPFYSEAFPVTRGLDHPNEISAYILADYFKELYSNNKAFSELPSSAKRNTDLFIKWSKLYMND